MYRRPSRKYKNKEVKKPNLIPILDSVFIFIFFLLMSANFVKIFEISSDVPIISNKQPPKSKKKPLNLTMKVFQNSIRLYTGPQERLRKTVGKNADGKYDLYQLREYLISLKKKHKSEDTVVLMPMVDLNYEELVKIMDSLRDLKDTDPSIWIGDTKINKLFNNIIFGNIQG